MTLPAAVFGDIITINMVNSTLSGGPGAVLTFSGSLLNTTSAVQFLNNAQISGLLPSFTGNVTPFFTNTPPSLTANQSTANLGLFSITVPAATAQGPYGGTFSIFGGPGSKDQTLIGSAAFTVQVVPEPGTWGLMLTATVGLWLVRRQRDRRGPEPSGLDRR